jgi:drug/metabolite transporter (DMT)-like permease
MDSAQANRTNRIGEHNIRFAVILMLIANISLSLNAAFIKLLSATYDIGEITFVRFAIQFSLVFVTFITGREVLSRLPPLRSLFMLFAAASLILCTTLLFSIAITYIPISSATTALFTAPLIVVLLAGSLLGETVGLYRWMAVGLGMLGAIIVMRPGLGSQHWAIFLALSGAVTTALFHLATRKLAQSLDPETSMVCISLICFLVSGLGWSVAWSAPVSIADGAWFLLLGATGWIGHFLFLRAMKWAQASRLAPLSYIQLVTASALGYLFFAQVPDLWTMAGASMIAASGLLCGALEPAKA